LKPGRLRFAAVTEKPFYKTADFWVAVGVFILAVAVSVITVAVAVSSSPNKLAAGLLQSMAFLLSIVAAFIFGRIASRKSAQDALRSHAKSAFRRSLSIYWAFRRLDDKINEQATTLDTIAAQRNGELDPMLVRLAMDTIQTQVQEQLGTSSDSLEDWRDIVPEEVKLVEDEAGKRING
jgi:hypothetical protein